MRRRRAGRPAASTRARTRVRLALRAPEEAPAPKSRRVRRVGHRDPALGRVVPDGTSQSAPNEAVKGRKTGPLPFWRAPCYLRSDMCRTRPSRLVLAVLWLLPAVACTFGSGSDDPALDPQPILPGAPTGQMPPPDIGLGGNPGSVGSGGTSANPPGTGSGDAAVINEPPGSTPGGSGLGSGGMSAASGGVFGGSGAGTVAGGAPGGEQPGV